MNIFFIFLFLQKNVHVVIRVCVVTGQLDLLYETIAPCLQKDPLLRAVFLELLEEFVLDGQIERPPPVNHLIYYLIKKYYCIHIIKIYSKFNLVKIYFE